MKTLLGLFTNIANVIVDLINITWNVAKWLLSKCWKFILLFGALFVAILGIRKASKEDN